MLQFILDLDIWLCLGLLKGFSDSSALNRFKSPYWNKGEGFIYKWKLDSENKKILQDRKLWYYLWYFTPKYKAKFAYSSTLLVFLTDGWHLLNFLALKLCLLSCVLYVPTKIPVLWYAACLWFCWAVGFYFSYEKPEKDV